MSHRQYTQLVCTYLINKIVAWAGRRYTYQDLPYNLHTLVIVCKIIEEVPIYREEKRQRRDWAVHAHASFFIFLLLSTTIIICYITYSTQVKVTECARWSIRTCKYALRYCETDRLSHAMRSRVSIYNVTRREQASQALG